MLSASHEEASGTAAIAQQMIVMAIFPSFPGTACDTEGGPRLGLDSAQPPNPIGAPTVFQDDNSFLTTLDPCPVPLRS